jgi:hypothetical protein
MTPQAGNSPCPQHDTDICGYPRWACLTGALLTSLLTFRNHDVGGVFTLKVNVLLLYAVSKTCERVKRYDYR